MGCEVGRWIKPAQGHAKWPVVVLVALILDSDAIRFVAYHLTADA
jgi:hypothetical protein